MGMIIYTLISGPKRYHEIHAKIPGISDRLLTKRLNELVSAGLISKKLIDLSTKKVVYELTPNGLAFKDVIQSILNWIEICDFKQTTNNSNDYSDRWNILLLYSISTKFQSFTLHIQKNKFLSRFIFIE